MEFFRLRLYNALSIPSSFPNIRLFKYDIPLVLKRSTRVVSTEAHALQFLNNGNLDLPVPRIIDCIIMGGETFTLMTKIPGEMLIEKMYTMSNAELRATVQDVFMVLRKLWTLRQPIQDVGKVMLSASGHGMPSPGKLFRHLEGPYDNVLACYARMSSRLEGSVAEFKQVHPAACQALVADSIVYVHADLRSQNILVVDGRLSGIIDWENSGWLPCNWQLHVIRQGAHGRFKSLIDEMRTPIESEVAYEEFRPLLRYYL